MNAPHIPGWQSMGPNERAMSVIDWCQANGIETGAVLSRGLAAALEAGIGSMKEEDPDGIFAELSPMEYVHMIRILVAFGRAR